MRWVTATSRRFHHERYAHSRTKLLHLFDMVSRPYRMQPSYCFRRATATHRSAKPITPSLLSQEEPFPCFHMVGRLGLVGMSLVVCRRHRRRRIATPIRCPTYLRAGIRLSVTSYSRTTLAVLVHPLARRLGTQTPDFTHPPFSSANLHWTARGDLAIAIRIEWASASTSSDLPSTAMPCRSPGENVAGDDGRCFVLHLRLSLLGWSPALRTACTVSRVAHLARGSRRS
jgi:hypothetical protein